MVEIVRNLLKLTDYPFVYSLGGLWLLVYGHPTIFGKVETYGPLLLIMGIAGTSLAITDPFGRLIRFFLQGFRLEPKVDDTGKSLYDYKATKTEWISYEINKLVSTVYFFIVLSVFISFWYTSFLPMELCNMLTKNSDFMNRTITSVGQSNLLASCPTDVQGFVYLVIAAHVGVGVIIILSIKKLYSNARMIGDYFTTKHELDELERQANAQFDEKRRSFLNKAGKGLEQPTKGLEWVSPNQLDLQERQDNVKAWGEQLRREEEAMRTHEQELKALFIALDNDCKETINYFDEKEWTLASTTLENIQDSIKWLKSKKIW